MFRILAFIENDIYVRNFVTSGAFDGLLQNDGFGICLSETVAKLRSAVPANKLVATYQRSEANSAIIYAFNKISTRALRRKSSTFDIKVKAGWPYGHYRSKARLMSHPWVFEHFTRNYLVGRLKTNPSLEEIIRVHKPDLVIFPVTGVETTGAELTLLSRQYGFKTLFLVNGWDNLSSKGAFPLLPDYMGVWGLQSAMDAVHIHGMPFQHLVMMGCARYEDYFVPQNADINLFQHKYILFAGATTPNDEITPLRMFDEVLEATGNKSIKIVYRPHPWRDKRNCFDLFEPEHYKHVILDPQVADDYFGAKKRGTESSSSQSFPSLKYYPSLVNHALFLISPMSSMTLEAALFDVPALVLAHDDGFHRIPGSLQARYTHFVGADEVPGWFFARSLDELKPRFESMLRRFSNETPSARQLRPVLSQAMDKYLFRDQRSYAQRLHDATQAVLVVGPDQAAVNPGYHAHSPSSANLLVQTPPTKRGSCV